MNILDLISLPEDARCEHPPCLHLNSSPPVPTVNATAAVPRESCGQCHVNRATRVVPRPVTAAGGLFRSVPRMWRGACQSPGEGEGGGRQYRPVMLVRCNVAGDITGHGSRYVDQLKEEVIYIYFI